MAAPTKRAELVARQIEADVSARGWPVGEVIGAEPDLVDRYGVSRSVLREAVRLIEHNGVARMRRGPGGGLVVARPPADVAAESIARYFEFVELPLADILDARIALECASLALVARRADAAAAARLRRLAEPQPEFADHELHVALAELSGNEALAIFTTAGVYAAERWAGDDGIVRGELAVEVSRVHQAIVEATLAGDVERAQRRMTAHLTAGAAYLEAVWQHKTEPAPISPHRATQVAQALRHDLIAEECLPGDRLASEAELMERFGVGRAVFREAVRVLEHKGIVATRRGVGGGLVAITEDPVRVVSVVCDYLVYAGLERRVLDDVRTLTANADPANRALAFLARVVGELAAR